MPERLRVGLSRDRTKRLLVGKERQMGTDHRQWQRSDQQRRIYPIQQPAAVGNVIREAGRQIAQAINRRVENETVTSHRTEFVRAMSCENTELLRSAPLSEKGYY
jgi:hypothetical protein